MVFIEYVKETWQRATIQSRIRFTLASIAILFLLLSIGSGIWGLIIMLPLKAWLFILSMVLLFSGFFSIIVLCVHYDEWKRSRDCRSDTRYFQ